MGANSSYLWTGRPNARHCLLTATLLLFLLPLYHHLTLPLITLQYTSRLFCARQPVYISLFILKQSIIRQAMYPSNGRAQTIAIVVSALTCVAVQRGDVANQYGTENFEETSHCTIGPLICHVFAQCIKRTVSYSDGQVPCRVNFTLATAAKTMSNISVTTSASAIL